MATSTHPRKRLNVILGGRCFIDEYVNLPITRDTLNFFICVYKNNDNDNFKKDTPSYLEYSLIHQWAKFSLCILWTLEKIINSRLTYISMFIKNMTIRSLKASIMYIEVNMFYKTIHPWLCSGILRL